jgi:hypothetical protein
MRWTDYGTRRPSIVALADRRCLGISFEIWFGTIGSLAMSATPSLDFDCGVD